MTARAGRVAVLVATALAVLLLGAAPNGAMSALVETLSPRQARAFNGAAAVAAANHVRNERALSVGAVRSVSICGRPGFGFTTLGRYNGPSADDATIFDPNERSLTAHAVVNVDGDVWQAEYRQVRSGQNLTVESQMIAFASHFCIQRHYRSASVLR